MRRWISLLAALLIGGCAATASPTSANATVAVADAPPLIAGRLSAVDGDVRIWRAEEDGRGAWDRAELNDVVTIGVGIATDNGRAEVHVGPHAFRLGAGSSGGFSQLDFAGKAFNLERGVLNVRLAPAQQGEAVSVTVAGVQVDLAAPGRYRIDAIDGSPLNVTVFQGQGNVRYGANGVTVGSGQALVLTQSSISFGAAMSTELDTWAFERDERYQQLQSARYVSPYMTGYEELDTYGDWIADGSYGTVWVPRAVPVGWAPYRYGRWRWVSPWGWTWVDAAPWGYAPFHYGRWVMVSGRWGWWPGSYVARPVWAPALVGFVGTGGASVSVGFGGPVGGLVSTRALAPVPSLLPHQHHLRHRDQPDDHPAAAGRRAARCHAAARFYLGAAAALPRAGGQGANPGTDGKDCRSATGGAAPADGAHGAGRRRFESGCTGRPRRSAPCARRPGRRPGDTEVHHHARTAATAGRR